MRRRACDGVSRVARRADGELLRKIRLSRNRAQIRMEFWRCANLFHLCSYVLADKTRETYNLDNFLIPVAAAFGEVRRDPSAHEDS